MCDADDAAVLIQVMRDKPALLRTDLGMKAHKEAIKKIKGTDWEKVLFSQSLYLLQKDELTDFRDNEILLAECIEETQRMIDLNEIALDINYVLRVKVRELKEIIEVTTVEDRPPLLQKLHGLHEAIFHNLGQMNINESTHASPTTPEDAA